MANVTGRMSIDHVDMLEVDGDPGSGGGTDAPLASLAIATDGSGFFMKTGAALDAWRGIIELPESYATAASTRTLTIASSKIIYFTGTTAGQIVRLPSGLTIMPGRQFEIYNASNQPITVQDGSGAALFTLSQTSIAYITLQTAGTIAGGWIAWQVFVSSQASGILNYQLISSTAFTTSSLTDVVITGFTVTPTAGTYGVWYNATMTQSNSTAQNWWSFYKGGTLVADSTRNQRAPSAGAIMPQAAMSVVAVNGSEAVDVRVRANTGSITINARTILLIRLGS